MNKKLFVHVYHKLRDNRLSFKFAMRLKELGVNRLIKDTIGMNRKILCTPSEMDAAQAFIDHNEKRIEQMLVLLEDEKSRDVWKSVMQCRAKGRPVPKSLWSDKDQYFPREIIRFGPNEVFVDGGAFIGDTIQHLLNFSKRRGGSIKKIIAFEPDKENIRALNKNFGKDSRVKVIGKGLSDDDKVLSFASDGPNGYFFSNDTCEKETVQDKIVQIPCTSIDNCKDCEEATFVKMDIEGAEMDALIGGEKTIRRNHPKLAICIYHSLEDMVRIIEYIHDTYPEYKLYVRQHMANEIETVLYAVMQ